MMKKIYFDMDGTIADLYGTPDWLKHLIAEEATPYAEAVPLIRFATFARYIHLLQSVGFTIGIISWLSKNASLEYENIVAETKKEWLNKHLPSVKFDEIHILPYGTPKEQVVCGSQNILFDDEENNRLAWEENGAGIALDETHILDMLRWLYNESK